MMKRLFGLFFPFMLAGFLGSSCLSIETQEKRLAVYRSAEELRLSDIRRYLGEDPARAIHLIGMYRLAYGLDSPGNPESSADAGDLAALEAEALENLKEEQAKAIAEDRWDDAASLARSLAALGLTVENTGREPDFLLANAKKLLTFNDLAAFLEAVQAHNIQPLSFEDALLFLERAVLVKQRRTAAFFLAAALQALESEGPAQEAPSGDARRIPGGLLEYAQGQDTPQDMIKGVATVLVDRGLRVEKGRSFPDRVLGSAYFVDAAGFLITNYHVISSEVDPSYEGYSRMYIRLGDSSSARIPARVIGWDKALDLALIKAEYKPAYVF
ncbi:MAG: serine protease, partial [Treponema sp.]|nr:serine protease [Treponema sp.]